MQTIKLGNLADWRVLEGKSLSFKAPPYDAGKPRKVRLDLNCEAALNWYIVSGNVERFLAAVPEGLSTLEFISDGDFDLLPFQGENVEIHYWTSEAEEYWTQGDGESFATVYERQPRNEALEYVMFQAAQNQLRRDKAHAAELEAIRAEIGVINGRQTGIHGGETSQHQEPKPAAKRKPAPTNVSGSAVPAGGDVNGGADGAAGGAAKPGSPEGENETS